MESSVPSWFAALPDSPAARLPAEALAEQSDQRIAYPSGRPWLIGGWRDGAVVTGAAGRVRLAFLGQHGLDTAQVTGMAAAVRSSADLDRLVATQPGSFHLIAVVDDTMHAYGTLTGLRRLYHARTGGTAVVADRATVLAGLCRATLDTDRLATHLLYAPIHPLDQRSLWHGVNSVPGHECLMVHSTGAIRLRRWWTPPDPELRLRAGAAQFRDALGAAVAARTRGRDLVTADLGGLDSTAVCCLAARGEARVVAFTASAPDPLADDETWAYRTVAALGTVEHETIPHEQMPLMYHNLRSIEVYGDEPVPVTDIERWLTIVRRAAQRGSPLHLTGAGGDELLYGSVAHLHHLVRRHPVTGIRLLRGFEAKYRWPYRATLAQLLDGRRYRRWLGDSLAGLTDLPPSSLETPRLEWFFRPYLPPWASATAVDSVRRLIRAELSTVEPMSRLRGQHRELCGMRGVCRMVRHMQDASAGLGVDFAAPYYDHPVINAAFAVRPEERISPWRYKPLIVEAMRGVVPEDSRLRQTKPHGTFVESGLRRNRAALLELLDDSRLAPLGLVDLAALREVCTRPMSEQTHHFVSQALSIEIWLRSLAHSPLLAPRPTVH